MQWKQGFAPPGGRLFAAVAAAAALVCAAGAQARVTKILVDDRQPLASATGQTVAYEQISGRAFGELDPRDPANRIIQDIERGKDADGKVRYVATFVLTKPVDMAQASGLLWHDVPNRGSPTTIVVAERNFGDIGLASAWQGDNAGSATSGTAIRADMLVGGRHWLQVPVARRRDGSSITGLMFGRIVNRSGTAAQPLIVQSNPVPYMPASLDTRDATLVSRQGETIDGQVIGEEEIPSGDWAFCGGGTFEAPLPLTQLPVQICLKGGFDVAKLYQVVYTAKDPYVLGVGFAAWRDVGDFFKHRTQDDLGTPNPVASRVRWSIGRGVSQSGNYLRGFLHLGFNETESGRRLHEGMWPIIAGRRIALNFRWAQPDGVLELYQAGSEGPQWWVRWPDPVRDLPARGILDRCERSRTCPKIMEHFGSAEIWALKLGPEWVGTDARRDIPLPPNVRRYYIASSTHGGGAGGFNTSLPSTPPGQAGFLPATGPNCPGNNYGTGVLPANPVPHTQTVNALRVHFRNWVMNGTRPPDSVWPRIDPTGKGRDDDHDGHGHGHGHGFDDDDHDRHKHGHRWHGHRRPLSELVPPNKAAMGFPDIPGIPAGIPTNFINPVLDYDWGRRFDYSDGSGVPTKVPPPIKQVIQTLVPRVDADGNEVGGVPVVLLGAPLGTYLGWNITAGGARPFHQGQICNYVGGMVPFAKTKAERLANNDPRRSLEERYGTHEGYVAAVRAAAAHAVARGFLLQADADALIAQAEASAVLK